LINKPSKVIVTIEELRENRQQLSNDAEKLWFLILREYLIIYQFNSSQACEFYYAHYSFRREG
jgi:hypothetical protein